MSKESFTYATDMLVKALIGVCTVLLGLAQKQLETMSNDISRLTLAVAEVSKDASLATHSIQVLDRRLTATELQDTEERKEFYLVIRKIRESLDESRTKQGLPPTKY